MTFTSIAFYILVAYISFLLTVYINYNRNSFVEESSKVEIPVVDISLLLKNNYKKDNKQFCSSVEEVSQKINQACRTTGFFYIKNHGVPLEIQNDIVNVSKQFFSLSVDEKKKINMKFGGKAWRGYFSVGEELTSGIPDQKEGSRLYLYSQ